MKQDIDSFKLLMATMMKRTMDESSLFDKALMKLINYSEGELDDFLYNELGSKIGQGVLRLISGEKILKLRNLEGRRLICQAKETYKSYINPNFFGADKSCIIPTPETLLRVYEIHGEAMLMDLFRSRPGSWDQKWFSQDQIIEFCETLPKWFHPSWYTFFLMKNEDKPVSKNSPQDNLSLVYVGVRDDGLSINVDRFEDCHAWDGVCGRRIVFPQLLKV